MFNIEYTDKFGNKITQEELNALLRAENDYKFIGKTIIDNIIVSTVWLPYAYGIDLNEHFETMVFGYNPITEETDFTITHDICKRYETLEEAVEGHKKIVKEFAKNKQNEG